MNHFYQNIHGFFDFQDMYSLAINKISGTGHVVEIGTLCGKSAAYMAVEIINSNKDIKFDVIDLMPESNWSIFKKNLESVSHIINIIHDFSINAVKHYDDNSLDFVFIDSSHEYEDTKEEINEWYKKIKVGGILGGHDYKHDGYPGIEKAVHEFFGDDVIILNHNTWYHIKETL